MSLIKSCLAVALLIEIVRDDDAAVVHRLLRVADAHGFAAVLSQRRAVAKVIMVDLVSRGIVLLRDLNLHRRILHGLLGEVAVINALLLAGDVAVKLVIAADDSAVG